MPDFEEAMAITDWIRTPNGWRCVPGERAILSPYPEDMYRAMMVALRDYVCTNGFPGVILGLSGGIDSALSAAVAVDALGADKVWCVMLPSKYTSDDSLGMLPNARGCSVCAMTSSRSSRASGARRCWRPASKGDNSGIAAENINHGPHGD
jgi:NAD+ synthase